MKTASTVILGAVAVAAVAFTVYMVDIDQTEEARLPEVTVEGGNLPEFEAETGSIEMGSTQETVTVPDVDIDVDTEQAEVTLPTIDVNPPADDG